MFIEGIVHHIVLCEVGKLSVVFIIFSLPSSAIPGMHIFIYDMFIYISIYKTCEVNHVFLIALFSRTHLLYYFFFLKQIALMLRNCSVASSFFDLLLPSGK